MGNQHTLQNTLCCSSGHKACGREATIFFWPGVLNNKSEILEKSLVLMSEVLLLILPDPAHPRGDRVFVSG